MAPGRAARDDGGTGGRLTDPLKTLTDEIRAFFPTPRDVPVAREVAADDVRRHLAEKFDFRREVPLEELTAEVARMLRTWTVHVTHPRYFGLFNPSVRLASVVADALAALYNPQLASWSRAPGANEIERHTLELFLARIGFDPKTSAAHFTTGGAEANHTAVLAALASAFPGYLEGGLQSLAARPSFYLSEESHHSFHKIAKSTGLGLGAARTVPVGADLRIDLRALAARVASDRAAGFHPLLVVGTAGTTNAGVVDPLPELADFCRAERLWLHVDAAWGGAALLSPALRRELRGIERADSVTWDAHKWLSVSMGAGMFFCRHRDAVLAAFETATPYMPQRRDDALDPYSSTIQWTRRFIGLKVFMTLAELGEGGYARLIEHQAAMGDALRAALGAAGWRVVNRTALPVVCFTHARIESGERAAEDVAHAVRASGKAWISTTVLGTKQRVLRACITSFRTEAEDVRVLLAELDRALDAR